MKQNIIKYSILSAGVLLGLNSVAQNLAHSFNTKVEYSYVVKPLPSINTSYSEFCAVVSNNRIVFTSDREYDLMTWGESNWKKNKHLNIFSSTFKSPSDDSVVVR